MGGNKIIWFVKIKASDTEWLRYATQEVSIDGEIYLPYIEGMPELIKQLPFQINERNPVTNCSMTLNNNAGLTNRPEDDFHAYDIDGNEAWVGVYCGIGIPTTESDITWVGLFAIDNWHPTHTRLEIELVDFLLLKGEKVTGYVISDREFPKAHHQSYRRIFPETIGSVQKIQLIPIQLGQSTYLSQAISPTTTTIAVQDTSDFPNTGVLYIGEEQIYYDSKDDNNNTFHVATNGRGYNNTAPAEHEEYELVYEHIDGADGQPEYLYACDENPNAEVTNVRLDDMLLSITDTEAEWEAKNIQCEDGNSRKVVRLKRPPIINKLTGSKQIFEIKGRYKEVSGGEIEGFWIVDTTTTTLDWSTQFPNSAIETEWTRSFAIFKPKSTGRDDLYVINQRNLNTRNAELKKAYIKIDSFTDKNLNSQTKLKVALFPRDTYHQEFEIEKPRNEETTPEIPDHTHDPDIQVDSGGSEAQKLNLILFGKSVDLADLWVNMERLIDGSIRQYVAYSQDSFNTWGTSHVRFYIDSPGISSNSLLDGIKIRVFGRRTSGASTWVTLIGASGSRKYEINLTTDFDNPAWTEVWVPKSDLDSIGMTLSHLNSGNAQLYLNASTWQQENIYYGEIICELHYKPQYITDNSSIDLTSLNGKVPANRAIAVIDITEHVKWWARVYGLPSDYAYFTNLKMRLRYETPSGETGNWFVCGVWIEVEEIPKQREYLPWGVTADVSLPISVLSDTNPCTILEYILTERMGINASLVDSDGTFANLKSGDRNGWTFSRTILTEEKWYDILSTALWQTFVVLVFENGKYKLKTREQELPSLTVNDSYLIAPLQLERRRLDIDNIVNEIVIHHTQHYEKGLGDYKSTLVKCDNLSQSKHWGIRRQHIYADWIRDQATAEALAELILFERAYRRTNVKVAVPIQTDTIAVNIGDTIAISSSIGGFGQIGQIVRRYFQGFTKEILLVEHIRGVTYWQCSVNPHSKIVILPNKRIEFFINGVLVMYIDNAGNLCTKGTVQASGFRALIGGSPNILCGPGGKQMYLLADNDFIGVYITPTVICLDCPSPISEYNIEPPIQENQTISDIISDYFSFGTDTIMIAVNQQNVVFKFSGIGSDTPILKLKGEVRENVL